MHTTETIADHEVNLVLSKDGQHIRLGSIMVGPEDQPGWRRKDEGSRERRQEAKHQVLAALVDDPRARGLKPNQLTVCSRYTRLAAAGDMVLVRDGARVAGAYRM